MNWKKQNKQRMSMDTMDDPQTIMINTDGGTSLKLVENNIFFYEDVNDYSILELNKLLLEVDLKLQNTKNVLGDSFTPIIHLHMRTNGGEIYAALSTLDKLSTLKAKVYTYVDGCVASAGTLISIAGDKRFMGKHATVLIHQLSGEMYGKFSEMEDVMENSTALMKYLKNIYKEYTKIPMKKLDELMKRDIYLTASECLEYGIIDQIL
jgi:ATP-dependent Clp endopeptidase proteolytic subunit ClpP